MSHTTRWTEAEIKNLGATTDIVTAGQIIGIGRSKAYELAAAGTFPVEVLKIGSRYVVPVRLLLDLLGYREDQR